MSKPDTDLPERLRAGGATHLEQRMLDAAGHERPSQELSERMARALGIPLSIEAATTGGAKTDVSGPSTGSTASSGAAKLSKSLVPWVSGALVATGVMVGAYVRTFHEVRANAPSVQTPALAAAPSAAPMSPATLGTQPVILPPESASPNAGSDLPAKPPAPQSSRGSRGAAAGELAEQIALVDAARGALANGGAQRALSLARDYQTQYPSGTFRPEVAAVKVEALVKLGRMAEARTLAERFAVAYGPGPLADRVARLARISKP